MMYSSNWDYFVGRYREGSGSEWDDVDC